MNDLMRKCKIIIIIILIEVIVLLSISGCSKSILQNKNHVLPLMKYSYYRVTDEPQNFDNNANDIISPIVEQKFNIKVERIIYNQGLSFKNRLNQLIAANAMPDVISAMFQDAVLLASTGFFAETGDLIKKYMPNLYYYCPESDWEDALYKRKMYAIPSPWIDVTDSAYKDDLYSIPQANWSLVVRESILRKLGYKFKSLKEIKEQVENTKQRPGLEDYKIDPEIRTPDDLYEFLKRVQELEIKVDGRSIIPLSIPNELQIHLGYMYGLTGGWNYNSDTGEVQSYLGCRYAKEYYLFLNKLYREGLIDRDFISQKSEELQEKLSKGMVAACMWIPDTSSARNGLKTLDPDDEFRPIAMPLQSGVNPAGIDHISKVTFQYFIRKDFEDIPRLLQYFDWFLSDEAMELNSWGPEKSGIWEIKNGIKQFKSQELYEQLVSGIYEEGSQAYENYIKYGMNYNNKAFRAAPSLNGYNPKDWRRSYPFKVIDIFNYSWAVVTNKYIDTNGHLLPGFDDITNAAGEWCWNEFFPNQSIKLIASANEEELKENWNYIYSEFLDKGQYETGKSAMTAVFKSRFNAHK